MEKEINLSVADFELNLFYSETSLDIQDVEADLPFLFEAMRLFWTDSLSMTDNTFCLNLNACSDDHIRNLNKDHRQKDKITDVLSFPLQESIRWGEFDNFSSEIEIGDIFIATGVCASQAEEFKISFREEFLHLAVHGFLHLVGFDHEISDEEEKLMEKSEKQIIEKIRSLKGRDI